MTRIIALLVCLMVRIIPCWAEDIRDIVPPVNFPSRHYPLYLLAVIMGLALIALTIHSILRRVKRSEPAAIKSAWDIASERLEALRIQDLPGNGKNKEYYTLLSDIVRRFMEARFSVKAPEMTTPEFLGCIRKSGILKSDLNELLREFLSSCDMVKFAKYGPSFKEAGESFDIGKKLINDLQEPPGTGEEGLHDI